MVNDIDRNMARSSPIGSRSNRMMIVCGLQVTRPQTDVQDYKMAAKVRDAIQELEMRDPMKLLERELREAVAEQRFQVEKGNTWNQSQPSMAPAISGRS